MLTEEQKQALRRKAMQQAQAEAQAKMNQNQSVGQQNNKNQITREQEIYNQAYQDAQMNMQRQLDYQQQELNQLRQQQMGFTQGPSVQTNVPGKGPNDHLIKDPFIRFFAIILALVGVYFGLGYIANRIDLKEKDSFSVVEEKPGENNENSSDVANENNSKYVDVTLSDGTVVKGVTREVKEMLDSYEEFFDEYIEFMKTYSSSDNSSAMISEYQDYIRRYNETMQKINEMQGADLTEADNLYFIDVNMRILAKINGVSESDVGQ